VLILGGTGQARKLADTLAEQRHLRVITSLAGRTVAPLRTAGELRIGGFGGASGLGDYLCAAQIDVVIDATHPYAAAISRHAAEACAAAGRPLIRLERPAWPAEAGDRWIEVDSLHAAAIAAASLGRRTFLSIGVKELAAFATVKDVFFLVRLVEASAELVPLSSYKIVLGRGPFAEQDERALLQSHEIGLVIAKNSGGEATYGKIAAARALGLLVMLLRRPALPPAETADTIERTIEWVERVLSQSRTPADRASTPVHLASETPSSRVDGS
jgi:precorrin-6A/cobalt-precorrin-6A reductase